jgi:hypothetical protein
MDDLRRLVERSEDPGVELKESISEPVLREFSTDIAALANGKGGAIIFGITDAKEFVGCQTTGDDRERISQEAAKCHPPVQIGFEAVVDGGKRFLAVTVPAATTLPHSDFRGRTPVRVGSITAYLDSSGVVGRLNERGLLSREAQNRQSYQESRREPISDEEASAIAAGLNSQTAEVRTEALRDVAYLCHRRVVLDREEISEPVGRILRTGTSMEAAFILEGLRSVVLWGTDDEKRPVDEWFEHVAGLARDFNKGEIAKMAFDVLLCARRGEATSILADWVTKADDDTYRQLNPSHGLTNVKFYGLDRPMRSAMHRILEQSPGGSVKKRASEILEALRRSVWLKPRYRWRRLSRLHHPHR